MRRVIFNVLAGVLVVALFAGCGGAGGGSYKIKMTTEQDGRVVFGLAGSGTATVDWGDGSEKVTLTLNEERGVTFEYTYPNATIRTITVNGDNITGLGCEYDFYVTSLDIRGATALKNLSVSRGTFTSLDVSKNSALTELYVSSTQLTSLDLSKNTALKELRVNGEFTTLDVSKNIALTSLSINSKLLSLDISKNSALTNLYCSGNQLTTLDVSKNTELQSLSCDNNQLTSLDVSRNTALTSLNCSGNQLTNLDVNKNIELTSLVCTQNQITSLDVSSNTSLSHLDCDYDRLSSLDISNTLIRGQYSNWIYSFSIGGNFLTNFSASNTKMEYLTIVNCPNLVSVNITNNPELQSFSGYNNQLTSLDVSNCPKLRQLLIYGNPLTADALNTLFATMNDTSGSSIHRTGIKLILITDTPGANDCNRSIAMNKGWSFRLY